MGLGDILSIVPEAIVRADESFRIIMFSQGAEKTFGYTADEVIGQSLDMLIPSRFRKSHRKHIRNFAGSPEPNRLVDQRQEIVGLRTDGTEFPADTSISKLNIAGETTFTATLRDITEHKQSEKALHESEATLRVFIDHFPGEIFVKDREGRYLLIDQEYKRRYGMTLENAKGKDDHRLLSPRSG